MSERVGRTAVVLRTAWLTPHMVRVTLGGAGLAGFGAGEFTDHYVKLLLDEPGSDAQVRRTYTVRRWDAEAGELDIDFVAHGDEGLAGPWAAAAKPGDEISLLGPGGEYAPDPTADWHLFVGDASALPAIAAGLERVPAGVPALAFLEIEGPDEQQKLETPGDLTVMWLDRSAGEAGPELLADAVRDADLPEGRVHAFVHGEAASVRAVRRLLLVELGVPRDALSVSGYWKRGRTEEGWRADKSDWKRQVLEDELA
ncbi:siderophore-interacting protein [Acidothermaceae bacterium B102]|nr:siderophore-interacting protein [Acidothermaceae bacterium B102]